jgi:hypothetical protein
LEWIGSDVVEEACKILNSWRSLLVEPLAVKQKREKEE